MFATPLDTIVYNLEKSQALFHRYLDDLKPAEFEHQPCPGANCAAWVVGHLALVDRRRLTALGAELPPLPVGFEERFAATRAAAGTQGGYGDPKELVALFDRHRDKLIAAVRTADPAKLAAAVPTPHPMFADAGEATAFMGLHTAMHLGQITVIRRMLGYPPVS